MLEFLEDTVTDQTIAGNVQIGIAAVAMSFGVLAVVDSILI